LPQQRKAGSIAYSVHRINFSGKRFFPSLHRTRRSGDRVPAANTAAMVANMQPVPSTVVSYWWPLSTPSSLSPSATISHLPFATP